MIIVDLTLELLLFTGRGEMVVAGDVVYLTLCLRTFSICWAGSAAFVLSTTGVPRNSAVLAPLQLTVVGVVTLLAMDLLMNQVFAVV